MSEEILLAAADLATVAQLRRERDALAIQVQALADQAADLVADRDHWTLAARAAQQRERTAAQAYQQQQSSYRELEALYTAMTERAQRAEQELARLRDLVRDLDTSAARELNYSPDVLLVSTDALRRLREATR